MTLRDELFEQLEPPPGGLAALRARLDGPGSRMGRVWMAAAVTCALALATVVARHASTPEPVTVPSSERAELAAVRVPLRDDKVIFYWVASAQAPETQGE
jgi:hypothetical protein